jgi:hypothetical protein
MPRSSIFSSFLAFPIIAGVATAQISTERFDDWTLETGPVASSEGEPVCRAVTTSPSTGTILEVQRGEGMTTVVFRKAEGDWPDLVAAFRFPLGGYGEFVFGDVLVWHTDASLLNTLMSQGHAILVDPDGAPHDFSLSGSSAAIQALSRCG